jgi:hypothetical protein
VIPQNHFVTSNKSDTKRIKCFFDYPDNNMSPIQGKCLTSLVFLNGQVTKSMVLAHQAQKEKFHNQATLRIMPWFSKEIINTTLILPNGIPFPPKTDGFAPLIIL